MAGGAELDENYWGVFDGHLQPGKKPALLLVDMVEAYIHPESPLYCETAEAAVIEAARLLEVARSSGCPIIHTCVAYEKGGANGGLFYRKVPSLKCFEPSSPFSGFPDALTPREGEHVITKQYPSAFFQTDLVEHLQALGVDTLVIGGFSTSGCVRASVLDALQYGFIPFFAPDACADRHPEVHAANIFDMKSKYGEECSIEEAEAILSA